MKGLIAQAERLCRAVAPETDRVYVLLSSGKAGGNVNPASTCGGWTCAGLDLAAEGLLSRRGRWCGPGAAVVLACSTVARPLAHRPRDTRRRAFVSTVLAVALHELAHVLSEAFHVGEPTAGEVSTARALLADPAAGVEKPESVPWPWHSWRFIRTCLHLAHRARGLGVDVGPADVVDCGMYGLRPTWEYARAMGDEPQRLAGATFAEIDAVPVPRAFASLWRADVLKLILPVRDAADVAAKFTPYRSLIRILNVER